MQGWGHWCTAFPCLPAPQVLPAPLRCSLLHPGCSPLHLRCFLLCPGSLPLNPRCSPLHPGASLLCLRFPASSKVLLPLFWVLPTLSWVLPPPSLVLPPLHWRCCLLRPWCSPLSVPGAPPPPFSTPGLSLKVHGVGWPPQGGVGPVLTPSLGAGRRHRPELPHVSEEGQHGLRPEAALHWVGGHPGGHHGRVRLVSTQAQRCERGLPG